MISSMKNWVQNFVQKMVDIFSRVKKTYPWMSDFHLTKTKLQLLSSFTTITLPLAFISIWYLPYYHTSWNIFFEGGAKICGLEISEGGTRRFSLIPDVYFNFFRGGGVWFFLGGYSRILGLERFPLFLLLICDRFFIKHIILQQLGISNK